LGGITAKLKKGEIGIQQVEAMQQCGCPTAGACQFMGTASTMQYGGQTPLKLARALEAAGVPVIGTSPDAIDRAEDRERFQHAV
ncbi:dihydroxy-acid dehydratase, partial [Salmonella enterica subsp. enterica serovar Virginia]|nr:dihydroxy-acid dehydratase [Salmonella enterica subsp. enterica serovar Virginia]